MTVGPSEPLTCIQRPFICIHGHVFAQAVVAIRVGGCAHVLGAVPQGGGKRSPPCGLNITIPQVGELVRGDTLGQRLTRAFRPCLEWVDQDPTGKGRTNARQGGRVAPAR